MTTARQIFSIAAASTILAICILNFAITIRVIWKHKSEALGAVIDSVSNLILTAGASICLIVFSSLHKEKIVVILLLASIRYLFIRHTIFAYTILLPPTSTTPVSIITKVVQGTILVVEAALTGLTIYMMVAVGRLPDFQRLPYVQRREGILRTALGLYIGESSVFSILYIFLLRCPGVRLKRYSGVISALLVAVLGTLCAAVAFTLNMTGILNSHLALWIQFCIASLWMIRSVFARGQDSGAASDGASEIGIQLTEATSTSEIIDAQGSHGGETNV